MKKMSKLKFNFIGRTRLVRPHLLWRKGIPMKAKMALMHRNDSSKGYRVSQNRGFFERLTQFNEPTVFYLVVSSSILSLGGMVFLNFETMAFLLK